MQGAFAIVDLETTGVNPKADKVIEIAIVISNGKEIIDYYSKLVYPEMKVPYRVTRLTGIKNEDLITAPKFYEVAKDVLNLLKGRTIVAHNAAFDYRFLKKEFSELGFDFKSKTLCTMKTARSLYPELPSYKLGNLCAQLKIKLDRGHRALNDAVATAKLFHLMQEENETLKNDHSLFEELKVNDIPESPGIYRFFNHLDEIIYVGKSINLRSRIKSHLSNFQTKKGRKILEHIVRISTEVHSNEEMALLYENLEIKVNQPKHNRKQRGTKFPYGVVLNTEDEYHKLLIEKVEQQSESTFVMKFRSYWKAREFIERMVYKFELCRVINDLESVNQGAACFKHRLGECKGACIEIEKPEPYNERIAQIGQVFKKYEGDVLYISKGRKSREKSFALVQNGTLIGFGYAPYKKEYTTSYLKKKSEKFNPDKDYQAIIKSLMQNDHWEERKVFDS